MAWTEPEDYDPDTELTAAQMDAISANLSYLKAVADGLATSAVKVNRTSDQSIPDDTWTEVTWNNQIFDYGSWWASGTDIIVPAFPAGLTSYLADFTILARFASDSTGRRGVRIVINGSVADQITYPAANGDVTFIAVPTKLEIEAADVITLEVFQDSGGALNLTGVAITVTRLFPTA